MVDWAHNIIIYCCIIKVLTCLIEMNADKRAIQGQYCKALESRLS